MGNANFRTNVLLKSIIGKDLITNDNFAVLELVKNSFDAGSKNVDITFENILKHDDFNKLKEPTKKHQELLFKIKVLECLNLI